MLISTFTLFFPILFLFLFSFLRYDGPTAGSSALRSVSMEGTGYSSDDTASEDEGEMWNERRTSDQGEDEEEDMRKRENELKQELNMATLRCEELKRTMIETKSFIDPLHSGEFLFLSFFPSTLLSFLLSLFLPSFLLSYYHILLRVELFRSQEQTCRIRHIFYSVLYSLF